MGRFEMRYFLIFAGFLPWLLAIMAMAQPLDTAPRPKSPAALPAYQRTYSDEVARRLGSQQGALKLFDISPGQTSKAGSNFSGRLDTKGAKFRLQW
jgi:hypothetical protein